MGKLAMLLIGVVIGSSWLTSHQASSATVCVDAARSSESAPARPEPEHQDDALDTIRSVGSVLWQRIVQPMLAYAATQALDAMISPQRNVASDSQSHGGSQAPLGSK